MNNAVWVRNGFPPFARLGLLTTATDVDRSYGVRVDGKAVFKVSSNDRCFGVPGIAATGLTYPATVLALTPNAYWRMGEASGDLADSSGNGNTMADAGAPTYGVSGAIYGDSDRAITLNGANANYFVNAGSASFDVNDVFTIVAWVKKAENGRRMAILNGQNAGFIFEFSAANQLQAGKQGVGFFAVSVPTIADTNYHMVAVTKNGATRALYIDGAPVAFTGADLTVDTAATDDVSIGRNTGFDSCNWNGSLDEIAVFPTALSAANVLALYTAGTTGTGRVLPLPNILEKGKVVETRGSSLGGQQAVAPWIGWIERPQYDASSGMVTVDCIDVAGMMGKRHSGVKSTRSGCAGLIARSLLFEVNARNGFGLQWDTTSEAGMPISSIDVSGLSLLDALNKLADFTGDEWWIRTVVAHDNLEMYLHWGRRQGFDLSQTVYLREGREVSAFIYSQDAIEETESVMVVGSGGEDRPTVVRATTGAERVNLPGAVVQQASETFRRSAAIVPALASERVVVAPLETDIKALSELARIDLEQSPDTVETLAITVNERANWPDLAVGNIVRHRANTPWGVLDRRIRIMESQPGDGDLDLIVQVQSDV